MSDSVASVTNVQTYLPYIFHIEDIVKVQGVSGEWYDGKVKARKVSPRDESTMLYSVHYRGNCKRWCSPHTGTIKPNDDSSPRWD